MKTATQYLTKDYDNILIISDLHVPYHHKDSYEFLYQLNKKLKPDFILNIGDEVDHHAISYHDSDPDLDSAGMELQKAQKCMKELFDIFPQMMLLNSNHGSLVFRKGLTHGFPRGVFKSYEEMLLGGCSLGQWVWVDDCVLTSNKRKIYFTHGRGKNILKVSQNYGMSCCQGHYHEDFNIQYWGNPLALNWAMSVGCLLDFDTYAFHYARSNLKRPVLGTGIIRKGIPQLIPLVMEKGGRWNKQLCL